MLFISILNEYLILSDKFEEKFARKKHTGYVANY